MVRTRDDEGGESTARRVTFEERQTLPSWFGPAVVVLSVPTLAVTVVVVFEAEGATRESLALGVLLALVVLGPLPLLFRSALRTEVRADGVFFRFSPFHLSDRHVPFEEIEDVRRSERRAYNFGLKRTRWGWEYRPNSTEGVEIYRAAGPAIFLGTERPHELREAIEAGMRRTGSE
ncbi:hypothetical protein [Natronorubrum texcoconense]|uniref:PH domain-containing protein n=1 Tax=Natronorubrum texcoconense TaxID=1095776 RepID=A0A1G9A0V5_9EURY|nr:hypothetical protein [Natronorubrum texcoconense]SDK20504.1 hypothetical protein SAMN04515672_2519 [Natronorubrum texcoconense]